MRLLLALFLVCCASKAVWADADEYAGMAWQPYSTAQHPCGIGIPPRGDFPHDRWVNARKPLVKLIVRQEGTRLCYVVGGIAEAPVIRVRQGDTLTITLRNEITDPAALAALLPAGTLTTPNPNLPQQMGIMNIVPGAAHVLSGRTNLHVHGFSVPPVAPQDEVLMGCVDPAVGPAACGQREMTYRYKVPADMPPGLYWYHPHMHGEVTAQMLAGLSGAIVVEGADDKARDAAGIPDRVFIVRQEQDTDSKTATKVATLPAPKLPVTRVPPMAGKEEVAGLRIDTRHELGCSNKTAIDEISLNGAPVVDGAAKDTDLTPLTMTVGTTQLWRVLNAATDAFLDLALVDEAGKPVPVRIIARDGAPVTDDAGRPGALTPTTDAQLVPPAGRVEFLVSAPGMGHKYYWLSHAVDTGCAGDVVPERRLALVTPLPYTDDGDQTHATTAIPTASPSLFTGLLARKTDRERIVAFAEYPRPGYADQTDFYIAERRPGAVLRPFDMSGPPAITVPAGAVEEWVVENWTNEVHAFHIHQVHFRVLSVNGQTLADPPLLDTVTVPAAGPADVTATRQAAPGRVRIKLYFPETLAGDIPFHCHLVDHEDNGMMGVVRVVTRDNAGRGNGAEKTGWVDVPGVGRVRICGLAARAS
jgi:FtsP/CotA-like multicopper oxidase with cupredoxin domain